MTSSRSFALFAFIAVLLPFSICYGQVTWVATALPSGTMTAMEVRANGDLYSLNLNNPMQPQISTDQGNSWVPAAGVGLPNGSTTTNVRMGVTSTGTILVSGVSGTQGVWRSTDGGNSFTQLSALDGLPTTSYSVAGFEHGPNGEVYAYGDRLLRSDNDGQTWVQAAAQNFSDMTVTSTHLFGLFGTFIRRSDHIGSTWTTLNFPTVNVGTGYELATGMGDRIFAVGNVNKVITSTDAGDTWSALQTGLTLGFVSRIAASPLADQWVCGRPNEVYYNVNNTGWNLAMTGLTLTGPNQLQRFLSSSDGSLYCWSNQGFWRADLATSVSAPPAGSVVSIFPNPSSGSVTINTTTGIELDGIRISDALGRVAFTTRLLGPSNEIDLEHLHPGSYQVELLNKGVLIHMQRLVIE